jgi:aspartyl/asparaginyl beta-hydroxylase (cupin superfamily)
MEKVIRDGFVAVLYSPGFGSGWYSWHEIPELVFDPKVVEMVENLASWETIIKYCEELYPDNHFGGADDLKIAWVKEGVEFKIDEYDGSESIQLKDAIQWIVA